MDIALPTRPVADRVAGDSARCMYVIEHTGNHVLASRTDLRSIGLRGGTPEDVRRIAAGNVREQAISRARPRSREGGEPLVCLPAGLDFPIGIRNRENLFDYVCQRTESAPSAGHHCATYTRQLIVTNQSR